MVIGESEPGASWMQTDYTTIPEQDNRNLEKLKPGDELAMLRWKSSPTPAEVTATVTAISTYREAAT